MQPHPPATQLWLNLTIAAPAPSALAPVTHPSASLSWLRRFFNSCGNCCCWLQECGNAWLRSKRACCCTACQAQPDGTLEVIGVNHLPLLGDLDHALLRQLLGSLPCGLHEAAPVALGTQLARHLTGSAGGAWLALAQQERENGFGQQLLVRRLKLLLL